jgi:hypothetical protein
LESILELIQYYILTIVFERNYLFISLGNEKSLLVPARRLNNIKNPVAGIVGFLYLWLT